MAELGVNVDHIATVRQARLPRGKTPPVGGSVYPDPVQAAVLCCKAGADSIVMHLREDRRHIQDIDVVRARRRLSVKFNLEMSIAESVLKTALAVEPDQVTLVPERRQERTTEGGLDLFANPVRLARAINRLEKKKIGVSLFLDPDERQVRRAAQLGVPAIELHTGDYANASTHAGYRRELERLRVATRLGRVLGLRVYSGHGLDYRNARAVARIEGMEELNIGYSIVHRALWVGLGPAVREMKRLIS